MKRLISSSLILVICCLAYAQSENSCEDLLAGKVSGVSVSSVMGNPVSAVNVNIRGINSLKGTSQPMWIVDGAVLNPADYETGSPFKRYGYTTINSPQNSLLGFSIHDIEKIEVVKDVSALARYGMSGAGGVVIVKTKLHEGEDNMKFRWKSYVDFIQGSHNHFANVSGQKLKNQYYVSGFWKNFNSFTSSGNAGGFRFNFNARTNNVLQWGMNSSASIGGYGSLIPEIPVYADSDDQSKDYRTTSSFYLAVKIMEHLDMRVDFGVDYRLKRRYVWHGTGTGIGMVENGAASIGSFMALRSNGSLKINYGRYFGKHHLSLAGQADLLYTGYDSSVMNGFDFYDHSLKAKGISIAASKVRLHRADWALFTCGGFVKASYDYDSTAGFDALLRVDSTPSFDFGKVILYPAVNAYFDIRKLYFSSNDDFSSLKLEAGWGMAGNERYVPYIDVPEYTSALQVSYDDELQGFYKALNRQKSMEWNVGIHAGFLSDRILLDVKYYDKATSDELNVVCNGVEFGDKGYWRFTDPYPIHYQSASLRNRGVEFDLYADLIRNDKVAWNIGLHGAYNKNVVMDIPSIDRYDDVYADRWIYSDVPGYSVDAIVGYETSAGQIVDHTGDGDVTEADMVVLGSTLPYFTAGLTTSLNIGRFTVDAMIMGWLGNDYVDIAALLEKDSLTGVKEKLTREYLKSGSRIHPGRVSVTYDVPLGKMSSKMGLKVNVAAANSLPVYGYSSFKPLRSVLAGVCIDF